MWNFIRRALGAALLASAAAGATAQPLTIKLGWATSDNPTDPVAVSAHAFKKALEKRSNGAIQVQLYPNRQLGDEKQVVEGLRFGTVDASVVTNAVTAQVEPAFGVIDLPFVFESQAHAWKVLDGAVGADLAQRAAAKGLVVLAYTYLASAFVEFLWHRGRRREPDARAIASPPEDAGPAEQQHPL